MVIPKNWMNGFKVSLTNCCLNNLKVLLFKRTCIKNNMKEISYYVGFVRTRLLLNDIHILNFKKKTTSYDLIFLKFLKSSLSLRFSICLQIFLKFLFRGLDSFYYGGDVFTWWMRFRNNKINAFYAWNGSKPLFPKSGGGSFLLNANILIWLLNRIEFLFI